MFLTGAVRDARAASSTASRSLEFTSRAVDAAADRQQGAAERRHATAARTAPASVRGRARQLPVAARRLQAAPRTDADHDRPQPRAVLVMVVFALSCFGLLLFLWLSFGGPIPLKPKGYRVQVAFPDATQLGDRGRRPRRRRLDRQGRQEVARPERQPDARDDPDRQQVTRRCTSDAKAILRQKTLLGETYVELTPGSPKQPTIPEGGRLPDAQVAADGRARRDLPRARPADARRRSAAGSRTSRRAINGRGQDLNDALGNLPASPQTAPTSWRCSTSQQGAVSRLVKQHRHDVRGADRDEQRCAT